MSEQAVQSRESIASSVEDGPIEASATPSMAAGVRSERCGCGGHLIRRTRKGDGQPFLGCTRFPTCRRTKSVVR